MITEKWYIEFDLAFFSSCIYMTYSVSLLNATEVFGLFFFTLHLFVFLFMSLLLSCLAYNHYNPDKTFIKYFLA